MSKHEEFPELTPEARAASNRGYEAALLVSTPGQRNRVRFAAFLREAMKQARLQCAELGAIADNLHSPPPPPPTLAEAREAARQLAGPCAEAVHAYLATLEVKP